MGKRGLAAFLSEPRFEGLPATLETPGPNKKGPDNKEVQAAKRLRKVGRSTPRLSVAGTLPVGLTADSGFSHRRRT